MGLKSLTSNRTALLRVVVATCVACFGAIMWGYDSGVVSGVLSLESFQTRFNVVGNTSKVSSNAVALLQAGGFFGALLMSPICERFGRRKSMMASASVFIVGAVMQVAGTGGLPLVYVGRVVAGLGIGAATMVIPTYVAEIVPTDIRGLLMALWQFWIVTGVTISYWVDYGVQLHISPKSDMQWRTPIGVQMVPAGMLIVGAFFLKESPRWLTKKGEEGRALTNLAFMRGLQTGSPEVQAEYQEIYMSIQHEREVAGDASWREMLLPGNRKRVLIGFFIMMSQQFSGTNAIGYYLPQIFEAVGVSSTSTGLFATGLYGCVKMIMTLALSLFAIEKIGRKNCLVGGGFLMGAFMLIIGVLLKTHPPNPDGPLSGASYAMIVCIYLYVTAYCFSWGPVPWVYASEIYPNRLRDYCVALCAASQWLWNFVVTEFSPYALNSIHWGIFILFAGFNFINVCYALYLPETTNISLEEMDRIFGVPTAIDNAAIREQATQEAYDRKHSEEFVEVTGKTA